MVVMMMTLFQLKSSLRSLIWLPFLLCPQSLTVILLQARDHRIIHVDSVNYDSVLPSYGTQSGMHVSSDGKVTSPVMMWLEAMDILMERLDKDLLARVVAVSGSAQQHGSVYLNPKAAGVLSSLDPTKSLTDNLRGIFSIEECPIWADSSTQVRGETYIRLFLLELSIDMLMPLCPPQV